MIQVKLDGNDVGFDHPGANTIADVVGSVSQALDTDLRIIKVSFNGEDITGQPERHLQVINGEGSFELETARALDLANETLESIVDFHGAVVKELNRTSEEFRTGSFEKANDFLLRCVDGMHVLLRTTHSVTTLLQVNVTDVSAGQQNLEVLTGKISSILDEVVQAQENRDAILIADLIEYELLVQLEDWAAGLTNLQTMGQS
ncbi:hypothetical protein KQI52_00330 [bacterium]|nr:hypothetical protein [bacterium]